MLPLRPNPQQPKSTPPLRLRLKSPEESSQIEPLRVNTPKKSTVALVLNCHPPLATMTSMLALKLMTLRIETVPVS